MNALLRAWTPAIVWATLIGGCAAAPERIEPEIPPTAVAVQEHLVYTNTTWSGDVVVESPVVVTPIATLTVAPGTRVYFRRSAARPEDNARPWITVHGSLVAVGAPERPVSFHGIATTASEGDDMLYVEGAKRVHLRECRFVHASWALHAHDSPVTVESCEFRDGIGGVRFQGGQVTLRANRFLGNRIGVRCLNASPVIEENTFTGNLTGIFFRQGVRDAAVRRNNFGNLEYDIKLGEEQTDDVVALENWWEAAGAGALAERIYDAADADGLGRVVILEPLPSPWSPSGAKP